MASKYRTWPGKQPDEMSDKPRYPHAGLQEGTQ